MTLNEKKTLIRILSAGGLLAAGLIVPLLELEFWLFFAGYLIIGADIIYKALRNILRGRVFDENFLMTVATVGAFCLGEYAEGVAIMLFYQVGELFQGYAVSKSRKSIAALMDIRPDYANRLVDGQIIFARPEDVRVGELIVILPGERIPLDGVVTDGAGAVDTSALTGEPVPREVAAGDSVISGCINLTGKLTVNVTKEYGQSTVAKVLELAENATDKKARSESFITRFARYYTPAVVLAAVGLALFPPLFMWRFDAVTLGVWVRRALTFLVVSCPCALVISVPLSFFGGIGGASAQGVLVKGSNYLEALARADLMVFDKTGTLTKGSFEVAQTVPVNGYTARELLRAAAYAEAFSSHPIAKSIRRAYALPVDTGLVSGVQEVAGKGVKAVLDGKQIFAGNEALMDLAGVEITQGGGKIGGVDKAGGIADGVDKDSGGGFDKYDNGFDKVGGVDQDDGGGGDGGRDGTVVYVAADGVFAGYIVIKDQIKPDAYRAVQALKKEGIKRTVMLTGDNAQTGGRVAAELDIDQVYSQMLPADKVRVAEEIMDKNKGGVTAYVGDGINDAPVLSRADVGIAMGGLGSDAAIEAADVVIMTDELYKIVTARGIARRTVRIARQNIVFALAVKGTVLVLGALGLASMWAAVFADVGVTVLAVLNAMRALKTNARKAGGG